MTMATIHDGAVAAEAGRETRAISLTPLDALRAARGLLAAPDRWCRSAPARRVRPARRNQPAEWVRCAPLDGLAQRWCVAGALVFVSGVESDPPGLRALERAALERFGVGIGRA